MAFFKYTFLCSLYTLLICFCGSTAVTVNSTKTSPPAGAYLHPRIRLPVDYDINVLPTEVVAEGVRGSPVVVNVSIHVANIMAINDPLQTITLEATIRHGKSIETRPILATS